MIIKRALFILTAVILVKCEDNDDLKVCLPQLGCLEGIEMPGYRTQGFRAFLGIPYAQPPVGDLRFRNPEPIAPWQGILGALEAKSDCMQMNFLQPHWPITGSEDCLYLNIYIPRKDGALEYLPIIFYIYGGGLFSGSAHPSVLGPEYFMDTQEVIVVTVNYRLGPFGFLSTGDSAMPGNFGLKDQLIALKWVNQHITHFGGNPQEITLFGHSAGAGCVHYHMLNQKSNDLFKRSILSSGNVLAPFVDIQRKPLEQALKIAHEAGVKNAANLPTNELAQILRSIEAKNILEAGVSLKFWFNNILFNYRPVLENSTQEDSYIVEHPLQTIRNANYVIKPWLTGLVSYTGESAAITLNIYENETLRIELNQNFDEIMYKLMEFPNSMNNQEKQNKLNEFVAEYMLGIHELNPATNRGFQELFSDYYFYYPLYKSLSNYMSYDDAAHNPVYLYKFSYHGPYTYVPLYTNGSTNRYDVVHFDDLIYQFRQPVLFPDFDKNSQDSELSKDFVNILVEFVKTGKPLHYDNVGSCAKDEFLTKSNDRICGYLEFINTDQGYKLQTNNSFNVRRMHLWDDLLNNIN